MWQSDWEAKPVCGNQSGRLSQYVLIRQRGYSTKVCGNQGLSAVKSVNLVTVLSSVRTDHLKGLHLVGVVCNIQIVYDLHIVFIVEGMYTITI